MDLFKPYRRIEESDEFVVYEFRTGFVYLLYAILLIIGAGYLADQSAVSLHGDWPDGVVSVPCVDPIPHSFKTHQPG